MADSQGNFDWAMPDDEVHRFANALERDIGTHLYGRRLYEVMVWWETMNDSEPTMAEYAKTWRAADKIVYSRTLTTVSSARTRIEREFDPLAIAALKRESSRDLTIGGPELAAHAIRAGLIDDYHLIAFPVVIGAGKRWLPDGLRLDLALVDEHRFASGVVHLHYRPR